MAADSLDLLKVSVLGVVVGDCAGKFLWSFRSFFDISWAGLLSKLRKLQFVLGIAYLDAVTHNARFFFCTEISFDSECSTVFIIYTSLMR